VEAAKKAKNMNQVFLSGCADIILQFALFETLVLACISLERGVQEIETPRSKRAANEGCGGSESNLSRQAFRVLELGVGGC
jgi:hypothetical protein